MTVWALELSSTGTGLTAYLVYDKYEFRKKEIVQNSVWLVRAGSQQQLAIYFRDEDVLQEILGKLLENPLLVGVGVFDPQGKAITSRYQDGDLHMPLPDFERSREGFTALEVAEIHPGNAGDRSESMGLSIPVFSFVNPLK